MNRKNSFKTSRLLRIFRQSSFSFVLLFCLVSGTDERLYAAKSINQITQTQNAITTIIRGIVRDNNRLPLVGATVIVKGTSQGVIADKDGKFSLEVKSSDILVANMVGFLPKEILVGNAKFIEFIMSESVKEIDNVIVIGYGIQKKETVTGAINSIGSKDILRSPSASVSNSIIGRLPGLTAVQRSGEPGQDGSIFKIRGIGTLNDGAESAPLIMIDGVERSTLDLLDPNEIESINILKDASSTAVYGVRGANGVILITTKSGSVGKPEITLSANFGWQSYTMMPKLVNAYEWATLYNEGIANEKSSKTPYSQVAMDAWKNHTSPVIYPDVDWVDMMFRNNAPQQQYNVNISGGSEKMKYFVSFGTLHQEGIYKDHNIEGVNFSVNPNYRRFNIRTNLDIKVTNRINLGINLGSFFTDGNYANTSTSLIFDYITRTNPGGSIGVLDGKLITAYSGNDPLIGAGRTLTNPVSAVIADGFREFTSNTYNLTLNLNYDLSFIVNGLSARVKVGYDDFVSHTVNYTLSGVPEYSVVITNPDDPNGYYLVKNNYEYPFTASESYQGRYRNVYIETSLNYSRIFGRHRVTALALYNQKTQNDPGFQYDLPKGLLGFVGRITYNYDNRYLAEYNMGYNGSENFAEGRRFGFFPAFSLGWLVTEEKFIPKNKILTSMKIRGSYGEVGNDKIGGNRYLYLPSTFTYGSNGYNFGTYGQNVQYYPASAEGTIGNPFVTWERAKKSDIGVDMKMFSNKLSFTGDLFWEKRDNILWNFGTMPSTIGATLSAANLGKVNNKGIELELGWESGIREFNYRLIGTFSYAKNKIIYMDEPKQAYDYLSQTGYSVDQYKGYINEGFINTTADLENQPAHGWGSLWDKGELNFIDVNGDGIINSYDKVCIGYGPYPEINYGLSIGLSWKNLELNALLQGVTNVTLYLKQSAVCPLYYSRSAQKWHLGRWTEERYLAGETITYPRMLSDNINSPSFIDQNPMSTFWLYDASYLRLRNLELAYNYRSVKLKNRGISLIRIYLNGTNLLTFSNMENFDPEAPSGIGSFYPMQKIYNMGFKVIF